MQDGYAAFTFSVGILLIVGLVGSPALAQDGEFPRTGPVDPGTECTLVNENTDEDLGNLQPLAKYEAEQDDDEVVNGFFEFNNGNVEFASDPPQASSGSWTSDVPVKVFILKQSNTIYYWTFDGDDGNGVTEYDYDSDEDVFSHFTFCQREDVCPLPNLGDNQVNKDDGTVTNTMSAGPGEGIDKFTFTLDGFEVQEIEDDGFNRSDNTWTWTGDEGAQPTEVDFTLNATKSTPSYFVDIVNTCGNDTYADPTIEVDPRTEQARLAGNAPNPFSGQTTIEFALPEQSRVTVSVYDMMGRKVATLVDGVLSAGPHAVSWNGQTDGGQDLASGVYLLRMRADGQSMTRRMTVIH